MSILGSIPVIGDLIDGVKDIVSEVIVDKDKKNEILLEIEKLGDKANERLHEERMGQIEINKTEAQHRSIFIAGWRPFIGWTCGAGIAWTFIIAPFAEAIARWIGWSGQMPVIDVGQLTALVMAMLGVGAMRSYDKMKGTSNDVLKSPSRSTGEPENLLPEDVPWLR